MGLPSYVSSGAATTANSVAYPATTVAGNYLLLTRVFKYPSVATPDTPAGWTLLLSTSGGAGSSGLNSGNVGVYVWGKIADGTEGGTSQTISATGTVNCSLSQIHRFARANTALLWDIAAAKGADSVSDTSVSVTADSSLPLTVDDLVFVLLGLNANENPSSVAITASGATFGTTTEQADTGTNAGDHLRHDAITAAVTAGSSSGAPSVTGTTSGNCAGAAVFLRMREIPLYGTATITDADDTVSAAGDVYTDGAAAITDETDTISAAGIVENLGAGSVTDADDTIYAIGKITTGDTLPTARKGWAGFDGWTDWS